MSLSEIIGENLRVIMAIRCRSITDIYNETGISRTTITSMRKGDFKIIQLNTLDKLAQCLEVSVADLVTEKVFYKGGEKHRINSGNEK
ncbi:helix-turn-helix domain-containing protein [Levilactobacillus brevis]|uniref:helix-turn-helix domain-containing protein n=1 Tax=Levilactobacillus brevis TaxID=1580 RepID=UPI0004073FA8|nr:helix-turn-helix transcriptional regulator [Levilactobacillus brevis]